MASYTLDNKNKKIIVKMESATDKEMRAILNFEKIGYEIVPFKKEKKTKEQAAESKFTKDKIVAYLEEHGTKEQIKKFNEIQDEIVIDKETGKPKTYKNGNPKKKGFIAALKYFKEQFKEY